MITSPLPSPYSTPVIESLKRKNGSHKERRSVSTTGDNTEGFPSQFSSTRDRRIFNFTALIDLLGTCTCSLVLIIQGGGPLDFLTYQTAAHGEVDYLTCTQVHYTGCRPFARGRYNKTPPPSTCHSCCFIKIILLRRAKHAHGGGGT